MMFSRAAAWNRVLIGGEIATVHTVLSTREMVALMSDGLAPEQRLMNGATT